MPTPRVKMPATAAKGEVFEVKTTIDHDMESGQRKDKDGKPIPRKIINKFTVTLNGKEVFKADWAAAISANPYCSFFLTATESGTVEFKWQDDDGSVYSTSQAITVS
ncbi:thiosulfate oxidation carrier complex protein SoxZ [Magnetospirillum sp. UT-4]|uniref:thiosulfate oxidation carrier complex protein SoxZ n=1 Tax=Magnetospirillum sp. UT-4 TaxID=2681467 RepID=UPI001382B3E9|nr:thiosulfate oxidation carrier complex protein SoxZ [Magnetospirillum sp. UT-4]CAA7622962.1 putative sulfur oxidation protein (SoxZ) [Magnetospirillum sp. UT-4]